MSGKGKGKLLTLGQAKQLIAAASSSGGKRKKNKRKNKKGKNKNGSYTPDGFMMERRKAKMFPMGRDDTDSCTLEYMRTLMDPFQMLTPCSPLSVSRRAFRYTAWGRAEFFAGVSGFGFFAFNPYLAFKAVNCVQFSLTTSAMGSATLLNAVTNVSTTLANSPVTVSLSGVAEVRLVAAGLRIRTTQPPLAVEGNAYIGRAVANEETDQMSFSAAVSNARMSRVSSYDCLGEDAMVIWLPEIPTDFEYYANSESNFPCGSSLFGPLVAVVNSAVGSGWYAEFFGHYEFISNATAAFAVPGHSDPRALPMVESVANTNGGLASAFFTGVQQQLAQVAGATPAYLVQAARSYASSRARNLRAIQ